MPTDTEKNVTETGEAPVLTGTQKKNESQGRIVSPGENIGMTGSSEAMMIPEKSAIGIVPETTLKEIGRGSDPPKIVEDLRKRILKSK